MSRIFISNMLTWMETIKLENHGENKLPNAANYHLDLDVMVNIKCQTGTPIRSIVSYTGSPLYNLNKYINNILKNVKDENNNAKNSATFSNYIRNVSIEEDEIMISLDVTSVYTIIPIIQMLNTINNYVNSDDQFTKKTAIPQVVHF